MPNHGFPSSNSGRLASKLEYKDWINLSNAERIFSNFFEGITQIVICILVGGLYYPWMVIGFAGTYIVARTAYIIAYYR